MVPFGETVLLWRLERRLSQEDLAKKAGISRPNLSAVERGRREVSLKTLRTLALALEVRPGVLADGTSPMELKKRVGSSRRALERVAEGVVSGRPVLSRQERELVGLLRVLKTHSPARKRAIQRAWLQLSSGYSSEMVRSLLQRIENREQIVRTHDAGKDRSILPHSG